MKKKYYFKAGPIQKLTVHTQLLQNYCKGGVSEVRAHYPNAGNEN